MEKSVFISDRQIGHIMIKTFFTRYTQLVVNYPGWVLIAIGLISAFLALGLPNFKLDASGDSLTLENDQDLDYYREVASDYQSGDFLIVTFKPNKDLFSDDSLELLADLKHDLSFVGGVASINSILNVPLLYSPKQSIAEILKGPRTLLMEGVDRQMAKEEFLTSPVYKELILGPDGQTTALQLNLKVDDKYIALVRARDQLRLLKKREGLSPEEEQNLKQFETTFLEYRTKAQDRNHKRVEQVREIVNSYKGDAEIFVGGVTMITADMITFIQNDLEVFGSAVFIFMIIILALIFKSTRYVVIPMACCLIAVLMMLGMVSWLDWRLTVISSNFVALLLIISLAIIIHLIVRYREYAQTQPDWSQKELVIATVRFMARPCFYTAITTIVAFVSLVVSGIRPVIDFGWLMSIGLVVALVLAFLIMPASLMFLPREIAKSKNTSEDVKEERPPFTYYFAIFIEKRGSWVLAIAGLIAVLSGVGISKLDVENRFIDYFHSSTEIYQGLSVIDNNLGGTTSLEIIINKPSEDAPVDVIVQTIPDNQIRNEEDPLGSDDPFAEEDPFGDDESFESAEADFGEEDPFAEDGFDEDDPFDSEESSGSEIEKPKGSYWMTVIGMSQIERLHDYLESVPEIGKVDSLATLYKIGRDLNGGLNSFELSVMENSLSGDIRNVLIEPFISPNGNQTRVVLRIKDLYPGLNRSELVERLQNHINDSGMFKSEQVRFAGLLILYNNMLQSLFDSQIMTLGVVFLCILAMFVILFQSFPLAIIALLPNMLASLSILGFMGLIGLPLDMMTITIAGVTLGIGVDDTIHYIHRFKEEIKIDGDYIGAMHRSHVSIGRAMLYTSVIIVFGFSIMTLSEFIPTIYFGLLTGLAMFSALLASLVLMPKLILMFKPFK